VVFKAGQEMLDKDKDANPEQLTKRARAVADMIRSYAPFAFAEVLFSHLFFHPTPFYGGRRSCFSQSSFRQARAILW